MTTSKALGNIFKLRALVFVDDPLYGAKGDGITDDTAAIAACIAAKSNIGVAGGGAIIAFRPGATYLCNIALLGTLNNSLGEYGICLSGYGATLKGRAADTSIITVNGAIATVPDPSPGGNIYCNGTVIEGFTLDMALMTNAATRYGIAAQHMFNASLRDIHVINEPNLGGGLHAGSQCYTWNVENFNCARVSLKGYSAANLTTAMLFTDLVANQVRLENVFSMTFVGGAVQGALDHFLMITDCQAVTVLGMDLEGTANHVYNFGPNCRAITSIGNSCGNYTNLTYSTGIAYASNLQDRPAFNGSIGQFGRAASQGIVSVVTPAATPIYHFKDAAVGQATALFMVMGDNGANGWQDLVMVFDTLITVVSTNTIYGAPPARTYTAGAEIFYLSIAAGTYNVRPVALEFLHN